FKVYIPKVPLIQETLGWQMRQCKGVIATVRLVAFSPSLPIWYVVDYFNILS
ncbi:MAG: hypothetical protein JWP57_1161, partial [Spirosoma sp.]|nr:hypothetical protein [Spirosoma sp.]